MTTLNSKLADLIAGTGTPAPVYSGRVHRFDGHMIECDGFPATIGTLCSVATQEGGDIIAEIIGFQNNNNLLCVLVSVQCKVSAAPLAHPSRRKELRVNAGPERKTERTFV